MGMSGPAVLSKRSSPASPKAGILQPNRRLLSGASWLCNAISGERRSGHEVWTVTSVSAAAWCLAAAHGPQNCLLKRWGAAAVPSQAPGAGAGCCSAARTRAEETQTQHDERWRDACQKLYVDPAARRWPPRRQSMAVSERALPLFCSC